MEKYILTPEEIYLYSKGEYHKSYKKFGAHKDTENKIKGIRFNLWAPSAKNVKVSGNFNNWQGTEMAFKDGVWSIFIPDLKEYEIYKYEIEDFYGNISLKADPYGFYMELRPDTASIVYDIEGFKWKDKKWLNKRSNSNSFREPLNIYEVHLGSWALKKDGSYYSYKELGEKLIDYVKDMGYTHIELLPIMEHPLDNSWGYQVLGYYAPTSRYGEPKELMEFIDMAHKKNIGVILDWVPGHFCPDAVGLSNFDGTPLFGGEKHEHWGTYKFDFNNKMVWNFLISNILYWYEYFHVDGIRADAITSMLRLDYDKEPGEFELNPFGGIENLGAKDFLQDLNTTVFKYYEDVLMIAEESTDWPLVTKPPYDGGLGFMYKWNMGWMNDTLEYMEEEFPFRKYHHNLLTFSLAYAYSENFILPLSHDEVVHGKKSLLDKQPGDYWQKFAGLRLLYLYQMTHPGKKLIFMGGEFGQFIEWKEYDSLDWLLLEYDKHERLKEYTKKLNHIYLKEKSLFENDQNWDGFSWIDVNNEDQSILSYLRKDLEGNNLIVVLNFKPIAYEDYFIGVPNGYRYREIFNSDSEEFGGSGVVNKGYLKVIDQNYQGQKSSLKLRIPPLGGLILKKIGGRKDNVSK